MFRIGLLFRPTRTHLVTRAIACMLAMGGLLVSSPAAAAPIEAAAHVHTDEPPSSYCYAGRWVQVRALVHPFGVPVYEQYQVSYGVRVQWRWFQDGFPQYFYNEFTSAALIYYTPSWYTSVEFNCSYDSPVWIYGAEVGRSMSSVL